MENLQQLRSRPRQELFIPEWKGPIEGWTVNYAKSQLWRVEPRLEFEDLLQEGYLSFCKCAERYPEVTEPQHFMALYKKCFLNKIHDLAQARTSCRLVYSEKDFDGFSDGRPTELDELELQLFVEDAPRPIQSLVASLRELPAELLDFARDRVTGTRETTEQHLRRLAGVDRPMRDLVEAWLSRGSIAVPGAVPV